MLWWNRTGSMAVRAARRLGPAADNRAELPYGKRRMRVCAKRLRVVGVLVAICPHRITAHRRPLCEHHRAVRKPPPVHPPPTRRAAPRGRRSGTSTEASAERRRKAAGCAIPQASVASPGSGPMAFPVLRGALRVGRRAQSPVGSDALRGRCALEMSFPQCRLPLARPALGLVRRRNSCSAGHECTLPHAPPVYRSILVADRPLCHRSIR